MAACGVTSSYSPLGYNNDKYSHDDYYYSFSFEDDVDQKTVKKVFPEGGGGPKIQNIIDKKNANIEGRVTFNETPINKRSLERSTSVAKDAGDTLKRETQISLSSEDNEKIVPPVLQNDTVQEQEPKTEKLYSPDICSYQSQSAFLSHINKLTTLKAEELQRFSKQLLKGLKYIHSDSTIQDRNSNIFMTAQNRYLTLEDFCLFKTPETVKRVRNISTVSTADIQVVVNKMCMILGYHPLPPTDIEHLLEEITKEESYIDFALIHNVICIMETYFDKNPDKRSEYNEFLQNYYKAEHDIFVQKDMDTLLTPLQNVECGKETDHNRFKVLDKFSIQDLPICYQHEEMYNLIKSLADLTVMIQLPWTEKNGFFCQGTGKISDVFICTAENRPCCCRKCKVSQTPSMQWGQVEIVTSANLLSSCKDVTNYKCTLFYDNEHSNEDVKFLYGVEYVSRSTKRDICKFMCITCDMDLLKKLDAYVDAFVDNWSAALEKYFSTVKSAEERLLVMVSHPHGCKKHISLGKWSKLKPHVQYDAATCPGCSGSYLLIPNFDVDDDGKPFEPSELWRQMTEG
ncbi:uncharacterized protein LOC106074446 [Biomphalaria glabrata]|uniref:Uncharacterized protein LOC106074446 n=1 Tax=Biomphalaria glabrata TaxID=6526 RepID=A0A9U8EJV0_BIOGL|nr:uncharacterized protein LOC106074446 [Biomphalaria glabrata]